jgi:pyrroloquinoline quinone biosynthesis protein D
MAASRSIPAGSRSRAEMSAPESNCVPRLAPGCRLNAAGSPEDLLLIPEGALRLKGPARTIVELCNGERTLSEIVVELQRHYPSAEPARIETEAVALLSRLRDRGALKYE